jgi:uncharacterized membrane protein HdeD (DUF308 family)
MVALPTVGRVKEEQMESTVTPEERGPLGEATSLWWLWLVTGILWLLASLVILQFDQASVTTVGVIIGIMFGFTAVQQFTIGALVGGGWALLYWFFGTLFVAAGVISFISPENTVAALADILGFLFFIVGVFWIIQAFAVRDFDDLWWLWLISGISMIILAFWTGGQFFFEKVYVLLTFAGIWALFQGTNDVVRAFQIRKLGRFL